MWKKNSAFVPLWVQLTVFKGALGTLLHWDALSLLSASGEKMLTTDLHRSTTSCFLCFEVEFLGFPLETRFLMLQPKIALALCASAWLVCHKNGVMMTLNSHWFEVSLINPGDLNTY